MSALIPHRWDLQPQQARSLQHQLRCLVRTDLELGDPHLVAGVDVAYDRSSALSLAAAVVLSYPGLQAVDSSVHQQATTFPYIPGLLSFRELPAILGALDRLSLQPDLILVDGQGYAHPRRFGIASHLGVWLQIPTIGIAKTRLCGTFDLPGERRGSTSPLMGADEQIGTVVRTRSGVRPVFVSVGFGLPLDACVDWTLRLSPRFRLSEPIRLADRLASRHRRKPAAGTNERRSHRLPDSS